MEADRQLHGYRDRLLESLRRNLSTREGEILGPVRVFVNQTCVGTVDGRLGHSTFVYTSRDALLSVIDLRTEDGRLLGSVCVADHETRSLRLAVRPFLIEMSFDNRPGMAFLRVTLDRDETASPWVGPAESPAARKGKRIGIWSAPVLVQAAVGLAVVGLVADRMADRWVASDRNAELLAVERAELASLRNVTNELAKGIQDLRVQRTAEPVSVSARATSADEEGRRLMVEELRRAAAERKRLLRKIQELAAREEVTGRTLAAIETRSRDTARPEIPVPPVENGGGTVPASDPPAEQAPLRSSALKPDPSRHPLMFWVSFEDGTSEESIKKLLSDIHGQSETVEAGWYNVQVPSPQPGPPEVLFDSLRRSHIVRAVSTRPVPPKAP